MTTHDHLRFTYILRLWKATALECATLMDTETDEELVELKRVALEMQHFEAAAMFAHVLKRRRLAHRNATEIFTDYAKRTAAYTNAMLTTTPPIDSLALELAKQMAAQQDELIRRVARDRIGVQTDDLDLAKRLKCCPPENRDDGTLWSLDAEPLVMIWPPHVGPVDDGSSMNRMVATFQYRIYP